MNHASYIVRILLLMTLMTPRHGALIFGTKPCEMYLYQIYSNGDPGVQMALQRVSRNEKKDIKIFNSRTARLRCLEFGMKH